MVATAVATTLALAAVAASAAETRATPASKPSTRAATKAPMANTATRATTTSTTTSTATPSTTPSTTQPAPTDDRADIDRSTITGSRELPKVLLIVPWKKPVPGELAGRPESSVLDEALAPVDRDVFRRQLDYDAQTRRRGANAAPRR